VKAQQKTLPGNRVVDTATGLTVTLLGRNAARRAMCVLWADRHWSTDEEKFGGYAAGITHGNQDRCEATRNVWRRELISRGAVTVRLRRCRAAQCSCSNQDRSRTAVTTSFSIEFQTPTKRKQLVAGLVDRLIPDVRNVGASLTGVTVSTKSRWRKHPIATVTVMVVVPDWLANGVTVTVRLAPVPPKLILPTGTNPALDELAESVRLSAAVSTSATVNGSAPVAVSSLIV
jgi:hypothetical protein